jgi:drug/metabolite transporter (DMT)-like permease
MGNAQPAKTQASKTLASKIQPGTEPPGAPRISKLGVAAVIITVVLWASAFVGIRAVGPSFSPGSLTLGRLAIAAVVLGVVVLPKLRVLPQGREWWPILAYGVMWFGGYNIALNAAEHVLDAGTSALLINVNPILVAVMAGVILKEGFPRWLIIGSLVAFTGVAVIALGSGQRSTADVAGVLLCLLCLLAAALAAVSVIIQKPVLRKFPAGQATWFGIMVGLLCCLPFSGQLVGELQAAPLPATAGLIYLGRGRCNLPCGRGAHKAPVPLKFWLCPLTCRLDFPSFLTAPATPLVLLCPRTILRQPSVTPWT